MQGTYFQFYQQKGFLADNIHKILLNGNALSTNVIIFEVNICDNASNKTRFKNDILLWKKELTKQNIVFCPNFVKFWRYNYGVHQLKRAIQLS